MRHQSNTFGAKRRALSLRIAALFVGGSMATQYALPTVHAADGTWTANADSSWTTATNWSGSTIASGIDFTATLSNVITANRTITLGADRTIGNITALDTSHDYTISGANILTLDVTTGAPSISVVANRTLNINSVIDGNDGLAKIGAGILSLGGANTYTGTTTLSAGTLRGTVAGSFGTSTLSLGGGTLDLRNNASTNFGRNTIVTANSTITTSRVGGGGGVTHTLGALSIGAQTLTATIGGNINAGNTAGLTFGAVTQTGTSTYLVSNNTTSRMLLTLTSLDNGGFLSTFDGTGGTNVTGVISGAGGVSNIGTGILSLSGANTYGGNTTANAGVIAFTTNVAIPDYATPATAFGKISAVSGSIVSFPFGGANPISTTDITNLLNGTYNVFAAGSSLGFDTTQASGTLSTIITNAGANSIGMAKTGTNTLTVTGDNTFTGPASVVQGTLSVADIKNASVSGPLGAGGTVNLGAGGTTGILSYTGAGETTNRVFNLPGTSGGGGGVIENLGTGTLTLSSAMTFAPGSIKTLTLTGSSNIVLGQPIAGTISTGTTPLAIVKSGSNTVTLSDTAGNTATTLTVAAGTFNTGTAGLTLGNAGAATLNTTGATAGSTVFVNGKIILSGVGTSANGADVGAIANVTLDLTNTVIEGTITNANIDFNPAGTVLLGNANTYQGQSNVNGSTAVVTSLGTANGAAPSSLGQPAAGNSVTLNPFSTILMTAGSLRYVGTGETTDRGLDLRGTTGAASLDQSGTGILKFTAATTATGGGIKVWTLQGSTSGTGELAGAIVNNSATNTTGINKAGTGMWTLSGVNTYTGPTTVNGGILRLTAGSTANSAVTVNTGAMLSVAGNYTIGNTGTAAAGGTLTLAAGGYLNLMDGASNTLTLSQEGTFSGPALALNGGALAFDIGATGDQIAVTGPATATVTATGINYIAINALAGIANGPYTLITANGGSLSDANFLLASSVANVGGTPYSLSLGGTATTRVLTVSSFVNSAPNIAFWNGTTTSSWNTQAGGAGTGGATNWAVAPISGALDTYSLPGANTNVTVSTIAPTTLSPQTLDAAFTINSLTFSGTGTGNTAGATINAGTGGALTINAAALNGNALGNGITVQAGSGANTINAPITLGGSQTWTNNSTNTLTAGGIINETVALTGLTKAGSGTIALTNAASTYTGPTTINAGTLSITAVANGGLPSSIGQASSAASNLVFAANTTLQYTGSNAVSDRGYTINTGTTATIEVTNPTTNVSLAGHTGAATNGVLTKTGPGTLTLTGANNNTGNTNVTGGTLVITGGTSLASAKLLVGFGATSAGAVIFTNTANLSFSPGGGSDFFSLGGTGGYGYARNNGGTVTSGQLALGGNSAGANTTGVFEQTGGTYTMASANGWILTGWQDSNANGVMNIYGGSVNNLSTSNNTTHAFEANNNSFGMYNVLGPTAVFSHTQPSRGFQLAATTGNFAGVLNISGGGKVATNFVTAANAGTPSYLSFNNGTLEAASNNTLISNLTNATIYSGGATIDSNGFNVTITQPLLAPTGSGVSSIPLTTGGSGYIGAPAVRITGGGGTGATAIANVDLDPMSGTYGQITGFTITSAGNGYTSAPTITLIGGGAQTAATAGTPTTSVTSTAGGLTKTGAGTLTLSGANTYLGGTNVNVGTLALGANDVLADIGNVSINGGTLDVVSYSDTVGTVTLASGSINGSTGSLTSNNIQLQSGSASAILSGSGTVTKTTAGIVTLTGANTFTVPIDVNAGTISFAGPTPATAGPLGNNANINLNNGTISYTGSGLPNNLNKVVAIGAGNGTIDVSNSLGSLTIPSVTSTGGNLVKTGPGVAQLASATTLNGGSAGVVVNGGTLEGSFGTNGIGSINVATGSTLSFQNNSTEVLTLGGAGSLALNNGASLTFELAVSGNNDAIRYNTASATGSITLNFLGITGFGAGTYNLLNLNTGASNQLAGVNFNLGSAPLGFNYTITNNGTLVQLTTTAYTPIFWSGLTNSSWTSAGNFASDAAGTTPAGHAPLATETVIFNATNAVGPTITTTLDGSTTIDSLQFNGFGTPATSSVTISQGTGGTLTLKPASASGGIALLTGSGNATITAPVVLDNTISASQTWSVADVGSTLDISGNVTFGANVNKTGAGTLTLSGTNTGSGAITLSGGKLYINSATALGTGTFSIAAGTTIDTTLAATTVTTNNVQNWNGSFTFAGSQDLNLGTGAVTLANNPTVTTAAGTLTVGGAISGGSNSLSKDGPGSLLLNGNNSYNGLTTVNGGVLTLAGANTGSGGVTLNAGTLNINNAAALGTGLLTIENGTTIDNSSGAAITTSTNNNAQAWNGSFTFTGSNNLDLGTGAITLGTVANPTVTLAAGTLTVGGNITGTSTLSTSGAGNFVLTGSTTNTGTITFGNTGTTTVNGNLAHDGGTTVSAGVVTLSGTNSYTGATTIRSGTVNANSTQALANNLVMGDTSGTAGTLNVNQDNTVTGLAVNTLTTVLTPNTITIAPTKTLTVTGNLTIGTTATAANQLTNLVVGGGGSLIQTATGGLFQVGGSGAGTGLSLNSTLDLTGLNSVTLSLGATGTVRVNQPTGTNVSGNLSSLLLPTPTVGISSSTPVTTITSNFFNVGDNGGNGAGAGQTNSVLLGTGLTTLNVNTVNVGTGGRDFGQITFAAGNGSIVVRGAAGGTTRTGMNIGTGNANTGVAAGAGVSNNVDFTGHNADLLLSNLAIGAQNRNTNRTDSFSFDQGILDVTTVAVGTNSGTANTGASNNTWTSTLNLAGGTTTIGTGGLDVANGTTAVTGTDILNGVVNISGGTNTIDNSATLSAAVRLGRNTVATGLTTNGTLNITGGTTTISGDVIDGAGAGTGNSILTLDGGTLNMNGNRIGGTAAANNITTLNFRSGTLSNVAQINNGGAWSKTTANTLTVTGTNSYTSNVTVSDGTLTYDAMSSLSPATATGVLIVDGATSVANIQGTYNSPDGNANAFFQIQNGGTLNFSGNAILTNMTTGAGIRIGEAGAGTLNMTAGSLTYTTIATSNFVIGRTTGASGTLNVTGGTLTSTGLGGFLIANDVGTSGTVNVGGTGTLAINSTGNFRIGGNAGSTAATFNLTTGGTLLLGTSPSTIGGTSTINFDGGTLRASANINIPATFTAANIKNGGAIFDTNGNSITVDQNLVNFPTATTDTLTKNGAGTLTLGGINTYSNTTTVNGGTLAVTGSLANNSSAHILMAAPDDSLTGNPVLTRSVPATANAFAGFGSKVTAASIESPLLTNTALQTTADILLSNTNADVDTLSMQWRQRSVAEASPSNTNAVLSDVINITGMDNGADIFVLQMSYTDAALGSLNETAIATSGELRLGWNDAGTWKTATAGNTIPGSTFAGVTSWADFVTANSVTSANLNTFLGSYGVDPTGAGGVVWAVLDHNSEFAVIPEPSTLVLGGLALLGFAGVGLRRRRLVKKPA